MAIIFNGSSSSKIQATQSSGASAPTTIPTQKKGGRGEVVNWSYLVKFAAANTPTPVPPMHVPDGCAVRVRAHNGTTAGNAAVAFTARYRGAFANGNATPLAPLDDILYPVRNAGEIWAQGAQNDGVVVSIVTQPNS
jgi:hypothetical protein